MTTQNTYSVDLNGTQNSSTIDEHWNVGPYSYYWNNQTPNIATPMPFWGSEITAPTNAGIQKLRIQSLDDATVSSSVQWIIHGNWSGTPIILKLNASSTTAQAIPGFTGYNAQVVSRIVGTQTFYDLVITKTGTLGTGTDFQNILRSIEFDDTSTATRERTDQYAVQISPDGSTWYGAGVGQADHANIYIDSLPPSLTIAAFHDNLIMLNFDDQLAPGSWQGAMPADLNRFTVKVNGVTVNSATMSINTDNHSIILTLAQSLSPTAVVNVSYTDTAGDQIDGVIQDTALNDTGSFNVNANYAAFGIQYQVNTAEISNYTQLYFENGSTDAIAGDTDTQYAQLTEYNATTREFTLEVVHQIANNPLYVSGGQDYYGERYVAAMMEVKGVFDSSNPYPYELNQKITSDQLDNFALGSNSKVVITQLKNIAIASSDGVNLNGAKYYFDTSVFPNLNVNFIANGSTNVLFSGNDSLTGNVGNDVLDGFAGNDTLNGGAGNDTYNIDDTGGSGVIIDSSGIDTVNWYGHHDGQGHFDINVSRGGANDADLVVTASQHGVVKQTTTIVGQFSSNTPVIETIVKNPDDNPDIYSFINSLNGTINNDFVVGTNSNDILNGDDGQDLLFGGNGNDTLNGGDRGDKLYGGLGNDSLVGGGGDDQLSSGYGNDKLVGGTGDDEYELYPQKGSSTSGSNTIEESQNEGNDWIYISDAYNVDMTRSNNGKDLVISAYQNGVFVGVNTVVNQYSVANSVAVENYSLWLDGSDKTWAFINSFNGNPTQIINELLVGASSNDTLNGYGGDDLLFGGGGNDTLSGGAGDDALDGGDGNDIAVYQGIKSDYIMNKNSDGSWTVTDSVLNRDGVDTLTNIEKLQFSDQLYTLIDTTPPIVSNFTPSDGATAITMESNIVLTFSEAIQKGTGDICLRIGSATGTIIEQFDAENSNRLLISGNTLTIDPTSSLVNDTNYFVTFGSGTVKDLAGNVYAGMNGYDFTTGSNLTSGKHTISVIVDKGVLSSNAVLLKELTENISTTNGLVTNHTVEYSGVTFDYNQIDSLITTVTRDGEFTSEFNKEINDYVQEELNISYKAAVTLVGVQNIDNIIVLVAGADGNYVV